MYRNPDEKQELFSFIKKTVDEAFDKSNFQTENPSPAQLDYKHQGRIIKALVFLATIFLLGAFGTCATEKVFPSAEPENVQMLRATVNIISTDERSCRFACEPYSVKRVNDSACECSETLLPQDQLIFTRTSNNLQTQANSN